MIPTETSTFLKSCLSDVAAAFNADFDILYPYMPPDPLSAIEPILDVMTLNLAPALSLPSTPLATRRGPIALMLNWLRIPSEHGRSSNDSRLRTPAFAMTTSKVSGKVELLFICSTASSYYLT